MSLPVQSVWSMCMDSVSQQVSGQAFRTWFEPLKPLSLEPTGENLELLVEIPSRFYRDWIDQHYTGLLGVEASRAAGRQTRLRYRVNGQALREEKVREEKPVPARPAAQELRPPTPRSEQRPKVPLQPTCNTGYTFDRFIEGECNRLARSAAMAIARQPGQTSFNPFLIYGGVGLGKTHLVQAIANHAITSGTAEKVVYVSSEQFTTDFVRAIQNHMLAEFTRYYRQIDLLIVDDIQFFGGKEKTQEEFFHIFNDLHQRGKQVVLCADRPPKAIAGIEERLISRFQWGLTADIRMPGPETRLAILRHKAAAENLHVPDAVLEFIAQRVSTNIRELEGALKKLHAHALLQHRQIDMPFACDALRGLISDNPTHLDIPDVQRIVAEFYGMTAPILLSRTRKREVAGARQVAMYLCKQYTSHTLEKIGFAFGGRDHSTVIHAVTSVGNRLDVEPAFREEITALRQQLDPRSLYQS